jgi:hypothetical protein
MEREEKIGEMISVGDGTEKVSALIPKKLLDRLIAAYRKKVGAVKDHGIKSSALIYFSSRGLLDWEDAHREDEDRKKRSRHSSDNLDRS